MTEHRSHFESQACPRCGKGPITTRPVDQTFEFGEGEEQMLLTAVVPVRRCNNCGLEYLDDEAEVARHRAVCEHLGVLEPARIRAIRDSHRLSRAAFARLTGFGEATLARWEHGSLIQNIANDRYLRLLESTDVFSRLSALQERQDFSSPREGATFRLLDPSEAVIRDSAVFELRRVS